jgi:hypothetical protein
VSEKISMVRRLRLEANALGEFQAYASRDYGKMLLDAADEIERLRVEALGTQRRIQDQDAIMAELWERIHALTAERDEARREVCYAYGPMVSRRYAKRRGWDCFEKEAKP